MPMTCEEVEEHAVALMKHTGDEPWKTGKSLASLHIKAGKALGLRAVEKNLRESVPDSPKDFFWQGYYAGLRCADEEDDS
jgi:hypothetical protein